MMVEMKIDSGIARPAIYRELAGLLCRPYAAEKTANLLPKFRLRLTRF
jgi:hypothetical protein